MIKIVDLLCELYYNIDNKNITSEVIHEKEADSKVR